MIFFAVVYISKIAGTQILTFSILFVYSDRLKPIYFHRQNDGWCCLERYVIDSHRVVVVLHDTFNCWNVHHGLYDWGIYRTKHCEGL